MGDQFLSTTHRWMAEWAVPQSWRRLGKVTMYPPAFGTKGYIVTFAAVLRPETKSPLPYTRAKTWDRGKKMRYELDWTISKDQYNHWFEVNFIDKNRTQRWKLPTKEGAHQRIQEFADAISLRISEFLHQTKLFRYEEDGKEFWARYYYVSVRGNGRISVFLVRSSVESLRINPEATDWERANRELPALEVFLAGTLPHDVWNEHRSAVNGEKGLVPIG